MDHEAADDVRRWLFIITILPASDAGCIECTRSSMGLPITCRSRIVGHLYDMIRENGKALVSMDVCGKN